MATHNVKVTYSGPAQSQSNPDEVSVSIIGQVQNLKLIKFEELQSKFGSVVNSKVISSSAERGRPRADQAKRLLIFVNYHHFKHRIAQPFIFLAMGRRSSNCRSRSYRYVKLVLEQDFPCDFAHQVLKAQYTLQMPRFNQTGQDLYQPKCQS